MVAGKDLEAVADIVFTGAGDDKVDLAIKTYASDNNVFLGSGNDVIDVNKSDRTFGDLGNDTFYAIDGKGGNRMSGGAGNDTFFLGSNDRALGGDGNDTFFIQTGGNNLISGGAGADNFQIVTLELPKTPNRILDFQMGIDTISIFGAKGLGISATNLVLNQTGGDIEIMFGNTTLAILNGVTGLNVNVINFVN